MFSHVSPLTLGGISRNFTSFFPRTHFVHVTSVTTMSRELKALYEKNKVRFRLYLGSLWTHFRLDSYLGHFTHSLDVLHVSLHAVSNQWPFFRFLWCCDPTRATASSFLRFLDHTQRRTTVGNIPSDERSARRRDLTTHNIHNRRISMPSAGFEPTISAGERPQTY